MEVRYPQQAKAPE